MDDKRCSLVDLVLVVAIAGLVVVLLLPAKAAETNQHGRKMKNMDNLRAIHEAMVTHAAENRNYYPGVQRRPAMPETDERKARAIAEEAFVGAEEIATTDEGGEVAGSWGHGRHALMLESGYVAAETVISPEDSAELYREHERRRLVRWKPSETFGRWYKFYSRNQLGVFDNNHGTVMPDLISEWQPSGNADAVVLNDRLATWGGDWATVHGTTSVWGQSQKGEDRVWKGHVTFNDGRVAFVNNPRMKGIQYGQSDWIIDK